MKPLNINNIDAELMDATPGKHTIDKMAEFASDIQKAEPKKGLELAGRAYEMAKEIAYTNGIASSLKSEALCYFSLGYFNKAIDKASQALAVFESINDLKGKAGTQYLIADSRFELKEFNDALKHYLDCLKIYELLDDFEAQTKSLSNIGTIYGIVGDFRTGISYQLKAISANPNKMSLEIGYVFMNLADLYHLSGKLLASMDYLSKAAIIFKKHDQQSDFMDCYEKLGAISLEQKDIKKAQQWLQRNHDYRFEHNDIEGMARSFLHFAELNKLENKFEDAISMYIQALEKASEVDNQFLIAEIRYDLGQIYLLNNQQQQARDEFQQALLICSRLDKKHLASNIHNALSVLNEKENNLKEALFHFKQFFNINQKIWVDEKESESKNFLFKQEIEESKKEAEIYRLKNVELANANHELQMITLSLEEANKEKEMLLDRLREQTESLEEMVIFDGLTGLANRRHFDEQFKYEFLRAKRYNRTLSVALADIDFFKKVNDTFSHQVGDDVLRTIARIFKTRSRAGDLVARYGGEEFVFLFTETCLENAMLACDKIRYAVESYDWHNIHKDLKITISMGVANSDQFSNQDDLVISADQKLYQAKEAGRNKVIK
jgi:diguanylate cyclase (GGDEF)-like protein